MKRFLLALVFILLPSCALAFGTASTKTVNDTVTEVRYLLNEGTTNFWTDGEIIAIVNRGIRDIAARTRCYEVTERFILNSGTSEYTVSTAYIAINDAKHQSGTTTFKALLRGERTSVGFEDSKQAYPTYYYEANGKVGFSPLKDTANDRVTGTTAYVVFAALPSTVTGASTLPLPAFLESAVVYYTVSRAVLKVPYADTALSSYFDDRMREELDRYRLDFKDKSRESFWDVMLPKVTKPNETVR